MNNRLRSVCTQEKNARCIDRQNPLIKKDECYESDQSPQDRNQGYRIRKPSRKDLAI